MYLKYICIFHDNLSWDFLKDVFFSCLSEGTLQMIMCVQEIAENMIPVVPNPFGTWPSLDTTVAIT